MNPSLIIAGVELSVIAMLNFDQSIVPISGSSVRRMSSGAAFKMSGWRKHRITFSASGWVPPPLIAVDYNAPFVIELAQPVALVTGQSLPSGWPSRLTPWAETTITDQAGESVRLVYPVLTVIADPPQLRHGFDAVPSWELVCEEV